MAGVDPGQPWEIELPPSLLFIAMRALRSHCDTDTLQAFVYPALRTVRGLLDTFGMHWLSYYIHFAISVVP
jgi:hypothetical protein